MLSYENPVGFQGITYDTPRSGKTLKKPPEMIHPAALKATWYRENLDYLRRFSLEIRER